MPNVGRALDELFSSRNVDPAVEAAQQARIASGMDIDLFKAHPGIDASTASMLTARATKYMSRATTGEKPSSAVALFSREQFESHFGRVEPIDPEGADEVRRYYWQLKTGDGIEDLVVIKARAGMVHDVQGKSVAAAMWRMNPKAKVPVLVETPGNNWMHTPQRTVSYRGTIIPLDLPKYQPPPAKPTPSFIMDGRVGKMQYDPNDPKAGDISTIDRGSTSRQVVLSFVPQAARGTGRGVAMYEALAKQTIADGKILVSDTKVSGDAAKMYDALERRGFQVKRNEFTVDEDGNLISADMRPVFEVTKKPPSEKPIMSVRQAE